MIQREGGKVTLLTQDRIDTNRAPQFAKEMEEALQGAQQLVIDCSNLEYISSSGLRVVMLAAKTMDGRKGLSIVNVNEAIYEILETTGFTGVCDVERASE